MTGRNKLSRAVREVIDFYWGSGLSNEVPALAWYLLSSLVPLALGITALAAVVLGDYARAQMVAERLSQVLPHNVHATPTAAGYYLRYVANSSASADAPAPHSA